MVLYCLKASLKQKRTLRVFFRCGLLLTFALCSVIAYLPDVADAQPRKRIRISRLNNATRSLTNTRQTSYAVETGTGFDEFFVGSVDSTLFDSFTLMQLRGMKEEAQPSFNREDYDEDVLRYVVQKSFVIQSAGSITPVINRSDLRPAFQAIRRGLKQVTDTVRYSLQTDGNSLRVDNKPRGKKLLELELRITPKQGFDPQLRIGDYVRFRYDWREKTNLCEFGFDF